MAFVEDDTMDRSEPREALDASAPEQRALPPPEQPEHPDRVRGRHEAPRQTFAGPAGAAIGVVIASVVFAGVLATWLISSAKEPDGPAKAASTSPAGPATRPPGPSAFGNLVVNWSFEQDLRGWQVLGLADGSREPQGRTSGRARRCGPAGRSRPGSAWPCPRSPPTPARASGTWPRRGYARPPPASGSRSGWSGPAARRPPGRP